MTKKADEKHDWKSETTKVLENCFEQHRFKKAYNKFKNASLVLGSFTSKRDDKLTDKRIVITGKKLDYEWIVGGRALIVWSDEDE